MKRILHTVLIFAFTSLVFADGFSQAVGEKYWLKQIPSKAEVTSSWIRSDSKDSPKNLGLNLNDELEIVMPLRKDGWIDVKFLSIKKDLAKGFLDACAKKINLLQHR